MITEEMITKHHMIPISEFRHGERDWYQTFLIQTDYVANKIIEAQIIGGDTSEYVDIVRARQYAREQINAIDDGKYSGEKAGTDVKEVVGVLMTEDELRDMNMI